MRANKGKAFFKLLYHYFPKTCKFYKILNKNTVELSYSSMHNMVSITASHNNRPNIQDYGCNCKKKNECPMQNKRLTSNIIYEATVTNNIDIVEKIYFGLCETSFKKRYRNHTDLSGYKVIVNIQNYLNVYRN